MEHETKTNEPSDQDVMSVLLLCGLGLMTLALVIAIVGSIGSSAEPGITGHDLAMAVIRCTPGSATFEQELACFQAVYGGQP